MSVPRSYNKKRSPQPSDIDKIQELLSSEPSKFIAQVLQQEVRGLNLADLMAFPCVRDGLKDCIQEYEKREQGREQTPTFHYMEVIPSAVPKEPDDCDGVYSYDDARD